MSKVKVVNPSGNLPAVSAETNALLSMIERVCLDPSADIDKLSKMLDMQERILNRNAEQAFAADFAAMQCELPRIAKNGSIKIKDKISGEVTQSTAFAKLEDINDGIRPTLQKYGFGVSFSVEQGTGLITVKARLLHRLGHSEKTCISLPIDSTGSKNAVQANGSTISYGKRYAICALLNISTGDDTDGNFPKNESSQFESYEGLCERLGEYISEIKIGIHQKDLSRASYAWGCLSEDDRMMLWRAPSKGGCFTTEERAIMKSTEFRQAYTPRG